MATFHCEHCGQKINAPDEYVGRRVRCPKCREATTVSPPDELIEVPATADASGDEAAAEGDNIDFSQQAYDTAPNEPDAGESPRSLPYRTPAAWSDGAERDRVPDYVGLRIGASIAGIVAVLAYIIGVFLLLAGLVTAFSRYGALSMVVFIPGVSALLVGVFYHALSGACLALRDIAQNSFRRG